MDETIWRGLDGFRVRLDAGAGHTAKKIDRPRLCAVRSRGLAGIAASCPRDRRGASARDARFSRSDGSLALAIASYNAGPGNVRKWLAANGDPRDGKVDVIDWIEEIPFGETRNYVERVIENMEVYKNRLAGHDMPLEIMADLYAPGSPPVQTALAAPSPVSATVRRSTN